MDEDLLSPRLGRLIDQAKAVVRLAGAGEDGAGGRRVEGIALLTGDGTIYADCACGPPDASGVSSAALALAAARREGHEEIVAAAVAVPDDPRDTVPPGEASRQCLAAVDPQLPIVFKHRGRWVMLALTDLEQPV